MANLTRRLFLRRAAAVAPLAVLPAVAVAAPVSAAPANVPAPSKTESEIQRLAKRYRAAMKAYRKALNAESDVQDRHYATRSPKPAEPQHTPEEDAAMRALTIAEFWSDRRRVILADYDRRREAWKADVAAWEAANTEEARLAGVDATSAEVRRCWCAVCDIAEPLFRTRATTLDDLLIKVRIQLKDDYDQTLFEREIAKDLRALKKAGAVVAMKVEA